MAARSGGEVWRLYPAGTGLFVELLLDVHGFIYGSVGVRRLRGSDLLVSRSLTAPFHFHSRMCAAAYRRAPCRSSTCWLAKVEVTLYSLPLSANATARYVWMSRICEPRQVACPKAEYTERILNVLSPKAINQSRNPYAWFALASTPSKLR